LVQQNGFPPYAVRRAEHDRRKGEVHMVFISARFLSLLLTAQAAGVVLSHVMSRAGNHLARAALHYCAEYALTQLGKKVGAVEIGALLSTLIVVFLVWGKGPIFARSLAGLLCLVGTMLLWGRFHQSHQRTRACIHV